MKRQARLFCMLSLAQNCEHQSFTFMYLHYLHLHHVYEYAYLKSRASANLKFQSKHLIGA